MSLKYYAQKVSEGQYILPRTGTMHCDVVAFLNEALYQASEETLWQQAYDAASYPGVEYVYLMPDTHSGFGVPIGCVVLTQNTILMTASGYDISCGMILARINGITAEDIVDKNKRKAWIDGIELRVPTGVGFKQPKLMKTTNSTELELILRHGGQLLNLSRDTSERTHLDVDTSIFDSQRIDKAFESGMKQIASLGGGNHFLELLVDPKDSSVWVMVHTGSRGYGWKTANYYFYEAARLRNIAPNRRESSYLYYDEPLGQEYWNHHNSAANFAIVNRHMIISAIGEVCEEVFGGELETEYEISHNLIQNETVYLPDGTTFTGFVHRKGATRAFPAHHPHLFNTKWWETGHPMLIPGSMREGAALLLPNNSGKSACSVNHGSGRVMARGEAKRELASLQDVIDEDMRDAQIHCKDGCVVNSILQNNKQTPLDESGMVYKSLDAVLDVLTIEEIATIERRLYPVANIKAKD